MVLTNAQQTKLTYKKKKTVAPWECKSTVGVQEHRGSAKALWKCVINIYPVAILYQTLVRFKPLFFNGKGISESTLSMICDACFWMATDDGALPDTSNRLEAILRSGWCGQHVVTTCPPYKVHDFMRGQLSQWNDLP